MFKWGLTPYKTLWYTSFTSLSLLTFSTFAVWSVTNNPSFYQESHSSYLIQALDFQSVRLLSVRPVVKISPEWVTGPEQGKSSGSIATFSLWTSNTTPRPAKGTKADIWRGFLTRESGTGQLHDRYEDEDDDDDDFQ
jgi:hypothetical protein